MDNQNRRADDKRAPGQLQWSESSNAQAAQPAAAAGLQIGLNRNAILAIANPLFGWVAGCGGYEDAVMEFASQVLATQAAPASADNPSTAGASVRDALRRSKADTDYHGKIVFTQEQFNHFVSMIAAPVAQSTAGAAKGELSNEAIDEVWNAMPGGADGWLKQFGYFQFARSIARHVLVRVAASMAGTIRPTDDELWEQTIGERDHYHDMADKLAAAIGKHFGIEIGEHSNMNCPWHAALDWIENSSTVAEMQGAAPALNPSEVLANSNSVEFEGIKSVAPVAPEVPLWDENGEPWNLAAEQVEYERAQAASKEGGAA